MRVFSGQFDDFFRSLMSACATKQELKEPGQKGKIQDRA
jgi:hypothetical protein